MLLAGEAPPHTEKAMEFTPPSSIIIVIRKIAARKRDLCSVPRSERDYNSNFPAAKRATR